jgi:hypothetical protein
MPVLTLQHDELAAVLRQVGSELAALERCIRDAMLKADGQEFF